MQTKVIALCGKAGAGKDFLLNRICANHPEFYKIISNTTRPMREEEKDGVNYHFLTDEQFLKKTYIEETVFRGWHYGTTTDDLSFDRINIGVFNRAGIEALRKMKDIDLLDIFVFAADKERVMRQLTREKEPDVKEIIRRFGTDEEDFTGFDIAPNHIIYNHDADIAIQGIENIICSWVENIK